MLFLKNIISVVCRVSLPLTILIFLFFFLNEYFNARLGRGKKENNNKREIKTVCQQYFISASFWNIKIIIYITFISIKHCSLSKFLHTLKFKFLFKFLTVNGLKYYYLSHFLIVSFVAFITPQYCISVCFAFLLLVLVICCILKGNRNTFLMTFFIL